MFCASRYLLTLKRSFALCALSSTAHVKNGLLSATRINLKAKKTNSSNKVTKSSSSSASTTAAAAKNTNAASLSAAAAMRTLIVNNKNVNKPSKSVNKIRNVKSHDISDAKRKNDNANEKEVVTVTTTTNDNNINNNDNNNSNKDSLNKAYFSENTIDNYCQELEKEEEEEDEEEELEYTTVDHGFDNLTEISHGEEEMQENVKGFQSEALHSDGYANTEMHDEEVNTEMPSEHVIQENKHNYIDGNYSVNSRHHRNRGNLDADNNNVNQKLSNTNIYSDATTNTDNTVVNDKSNHTSLEQSQQDETQPSTLELSHIQRYTTTFAEQPNINVQTGSFEVQPTDSLSTPVNLLNVEYCGELASLLTRAARANQFVSPIWTTQEGFEKVGIRVLANSKDAITVPMSFINGMNDETFRHQTVKVFNLQQTNFPNASTATCAHVRSFASSRFRRSGGNDDAHMPCDICGNFLNSYATNALRNAPQFAMRQESCRYWISHRDVELIGFTFKDELEEKSFIPVMLPYNFRSFQSRNNVSDADLHKEQQLSEKLQIDTTKYMLFYNVEQLDEKEEIIRANSLSNDNGIYPSDKFKALSVNGCRYSGALNYMMRNYCRRYYFTMDDNFKIIFLTFDRLKRAYGNILTTRRYPPEELIYKINLRKSQTPTDKWSAHDERLFQEIMTDKEEGVIPPPFTLLLGSELVSLINAEHTDCYGQLMAYMTSRRAEKMDLYKDRCSSLQEEHYKNEPFGLEGNITNNNHNNTNRLEINYNNNNNDVINDENYTSNENKA